MFSRESENKDDVPTCGLPLRVNLSERRASCSSVNLSDWSLLDCCFGVPLFDADVNKVVCNSVVERLSHPLR